MDMDTQDIDTKGLETGNKKGHNDGEWVVIKQGSAEAIEHISKSSLSV